MSSEDGRFLRVRLSMLTDEQYLPVTGDVAVLGTWTLLSLIADAAWPAAGTLPRRVPESDVAVLVGAGLVTLAPNDMFRMSEIDADREQRRDQARRAGVARAERGVRDAESGRYAPPPVHRPLDVGPPTAGEKSSGGPAYTDTEADSEVDTETERVRSVAREARDPGVPDMSGTADDPEITPEQRDELARLHREGAGLKAKAAVFGSVLTESAR